MLSWMIWRGIQRDWNLNWMGWAALVIVPLWFLYEIANVISGGKLRSLAEDDDEFKLPTSFDKAVKAAKKKTPLMAAIRKGLDNGDLRNEVRSAWAKGDIDDEDYDISEAMQTWREAAIEEPDEAIAFLSAYNELAQADDDRAGDLLQLFPKAGSSDVFSFFFQVGAPLVFERLKKIADRDSGEYDHNDEKYESIAVLIGLAYEPAFSLILEMARNPKLTDSYMWSSIFGAGNPNDPDFQKFLSQAGRQLPDGFACVALLDQCNEMCAEDQLDPHPFSSEAGIEKMIGFLTDDDPEHFSYAGSVAYGLPFISHPRRDELLKLAAKHPDRNVAVESAWAGAKLGDESSIETLINFTRDWKTGDRAMNYLDELELGDRIPDESKEPRHFAMCEMANWLQHPNELTKLPETLEIVDHRRIYWPPCEEERDMTQLRWTSEDSTGVGVTGGAACWCFFFKTKEGEPVLDLYARHCNWEMRQNEMEGAPDDYDDLKFGQQLLNEKNPGTDWNSTETV